jgi:hypothetical protein
VHFPTYHARDEIWNNVSPSGGARLMFSNAIMRTISKTKAEAEMLQSDLPVCQQSIDELLKTIWKEGTVEAAGTGGLQEITGKTTLANVKHSDADMKMAHGFQLELRIRWQALRMNQRGCARAWTQLDPADSTFAFITCTVAIALFFCWLTGISATQPNIIEWNDLNIFRGILKACYFVVNGIVVFATVTPISGSDKTFRISDKFWAELDGTLAACPPKDIRHTCTILKELMDIERSRYKFAQTGGLAGAGLLVATFIFDARTSISVDFGTAFQVMSLLNCVFAFLQCIVRNFSFIAHADLLHRATLLAENPQSTVIAPTTKTLLWGKIWGNSTYPTYWSRPLTPEANTAQNPTSVVTHVTRGGTLLKLRRWGAQRVHHYLQKSRGLRGKCARSANVQPRMQPRLT